MDADFVTERIMVGGKTSSQEESLHRLTGVTAILNVAREISYERDHCAVPFWTKVGLVDGPDNPPFTLLVAVSSLTALLASHGKVLVHCAVGGSRSVVVVCMYLVTSGTAKNFGEALGIVKRGRKCASPNVGLRALAESLLNERPGLADAVAHFDEEAYLSRYADVRKDVQRGIWRNGIEHFKAFGFREGRNPLP